MRFLLLFLVIASHSIALEEEWPTAFKQDPVVLIRKRSDLRLDAPVEEEPVKKTKGAKVVSFFDSPFSSSSSESAERVKPISPAEKFKEQRERLQAFRKELQELRKSKSSERKTSREAIVEQMLKMPKESSSFEIRNHFPLAMMTGLLSTMGQKLGGGSEKEENEPKESMESPFAFLASLDETPKSKETEEPKMKTFTATINPSSLGMGPFSMMSSILSSGSLLSSMKGLADDSEEDGPEEKKSSSLEALKLDGGSLEDLKDEVQKTVQDGAVKMMVSGGIKEDGDPLTSGVGTFTEIIGNLFGKLASTLGTQMKADPMDRSSPFGIADLVGDSLMQLRGPHICIRELNSAIAHPKDCKNKTRSYSHKCQNYGQAMKCTTRKVNENGTYISTRIQECCEGFTTASNIKISGCKKEAKLKTPLALLEEEKVCNCTFKKLDNLPKHSTLIVTEGGDKLITFPDSLNDYDLEDGQVLNSTDGQAYTVKVVNVGGLDRNMVVLNCVFLKKTNIALTTGRGHVSEHQIKPAAATVFDILQKDGRFKKFLSILSEETIASFKNKSSSQTVLPFTDASFAKFPKSYRDQIDNKIPCIASGIARGHIFQPATCSGDLKLESRWPSRKIGGAEIVELDLIAQNGVVHVVDDIIVKEDLASWDEKLKSLSPELEEKLRNKIEAGQPVTIFVSKSMIAKDEDKDEDMENAEGSGLAGSSITEKVALDQVIPWFLPSIKALPNSLTTMGNTTIFAGSFQDPSSRSSSHLARRRKLLSATPKPQIGCSLIISGPRSDKDRVGACGASIYFLDKPIPHIIHTMESFVKSRQELKKFATLFKSYLKNNTLPRRATTLFAPVDDGFSVNTFRKLNGCIEKTESFVRRHLVSKPLCQHDFHSESIRPETVSNKNGEHLMYKLHRGKELFVEDSKILETVIVSNGIVHLVDSSIEKTPSSESALLSAASDIHTNILDSI